MSRVEQEFSDAMLRFVEESPTKALAAITGHFVGLTLALIQAEGYESEGDIRIDGGENRDITIHAKKGDAS